MADSDSGYQRLGKCLQAGNRGREPTAILGCPGALSRMKTPPDCRDYKGRSEPKVGSDDVLAAWVLSDVSRGRSRSTSYSPLMNSRRSAFILPGSTIAIPWEPPGYTFKIA